MLSLRVQYIEFTHQIGGNMRGLDLALSSLKTYLGTGLSQEAQVKTFVCDLETIPKNGAQFYPDWYRYFSMVNDKQCNKKLEYKSWEHFFNKLAASQIITSCYWINRDPVTEQSTYADACSQSQKNFHHAVLKCIGMGMVKMMLYLGGRENAK